VSKKKTYSDLKKRLAQILKNSGLENITSQDIRLWKYPDNNKDIINDLKKVHTQEGVTKEDTKDENVEENSGVDFPGESVEPFLLCGTTVNDDILDNCILAVEVKNEDKFAF
jgi:hypothetical protein